MEQNNDNVFTQDEIEVAGIMSKLHHLILESEMHPEFSVKWGGRSKRSNSGENRLAAQEIEDCSLGNELPNKEVEFKKQFLDQQLNAKKQKSSHDKVEEVPHSDTYRSLCLGSQITPSSKVNENNKIIINRFSFEKSKQPIIIDRMEVGESSLQQVRETIPYSPTDKGRSLRSDDNVGSRGMIDLNLLPEEALEFNSNGWGYDMMNSKSVMPAEARLKRIQIRRSKKNNVAGSKKNNVAVRVG